MTARLADDVFWMKGLDSAPKPECQMPDEADVVVIGGGYTGLTAAQSLAQAGRSVVVLERGRLGSGASGRNAGFAHAGVRLGPDALRDRFGEVLGEDLYSETVDAVGTLRELVDRHEIDCDLADRGYLYLAERSRQERRLHRTRDALVEVGQRVELHGPEDVKRLVGSNRYRAGLRVEGACSVQPAKLVMGLADAARDSGAALCEGSEVHVLEQKNDGVTVTTDAGEINAGRVLLATDGYTGRLSGFLNRRIIPIESFVLATEPIDESLRFGINPGGSMCIETKNFLCYWRTTEDGRLLFGGRASFSPTTIVRARRWLESRIRSIYPQLAGIGVEAAWRGTTGFSFDQLPHIGNQGRVYYAVTYCGGGVALATHFGRRVATWMTGGEMPAFARIPFPKVPLFRGKPWFLPLVGPYFALRDRIG